MVAPKARVDKIGDGDCRLEYRANMNTVLGMALVIYLGLYYVGSKGARHE